MTVRSVIDIEQLVNSLGTPVLYAVPETLMEAITVYKLG